MASLRQSGYEDVLKTLEKILQDNLKDSVGAVALVDAEL